MSHCKAAVRENEPSRMSCEEKMRLIEEYMRAASELSDAVKELRSKVGSRCGPAECGRLQGIVDERESMLEQVGVALEEHTSQHGC